MELDPDVQLRLMSRIELHLPWADVVSISLCRRGRHRVLGFATCSESYVRESLPSFVSSVPATIRRVPTRS
jgi:hypothetical protein